MQATDILNVIPVEQHQQVLANFNRLEHEAEIHKKYLRMADELAEIVAAQQAASIT